MGRGSSSRTILKLQPVFESGLKVEEYAITIRFWPACELRLLHYEPMPSVLEIILNGVSDAGVYPAEALRLFLKRLETGLSLPNVDTYVQLRNDYRVAFVHKRVLLQQRNDSDDYRTIGETSHAVISEFIELAKKPKPVV